MFLPGQRIIGSVGLLLVLGSPACRDPVEENTEKLAVTLELDRREYFPHELMGLTVTIQNPMPRAMRVLKPFTSITGEAGLGERNGMMARAYGLEWGPTAPEPDVIETGRKPDPLPAVRIAAGEKWVWKAYSRENMFQAPVPHALRGGAPARSGDFRLGYWGGSSVEFRVVMPVFEGMISVELPEWKDVAGSPGQVTRRQLSVIAFVLGLENRHILCLERVPWVNDDNRVHTDDAGRIREAGMPFTLYTRLLESETPIVALHGESDQDGNITLTWGDDGGHSLRLEQREWRIDVPQQSDDSSW